MQCDIRLGIDWVYMYTYIQRKKRKEDTHIQMLTCTLEQEKCQADRQRKD